MRPLIALASYFAAAAAYDGIFPTECPEPGGPIGQGRCDAMCPKKKDLREKCLRYCEDLCSHSIDPPSVKDWLSARTVSDEIAANVPVAKVTPEDFTVAATKPTTGTGCPVSPDPRQCGRFGFQGCVMSCPRHDQRIDACCAEECAATCSVYWTDPPIPPLDDEPKTDLKALETKHDDKPYMPEKCPIRRGNKGYDRCVKSYCEDKPEGKQQDMCWIACWIVCEPSGGYPTLPDMPPKPPASLETLDEPEASPAFLPPSTTSTSSVTPAHAANFASTATRTTDLVPRDALPTKCPGRHGKSGWRRCRDDCEKTDEECNKACADVCEPRGGWPPAKLPIKCPVDTSNGDYDKGLFLCMQEFCNPLPEPSTVFEKCAMQRIVVCWLLVQPTLPPPSATSSVTLPPSTVVEVTATPTADLVSRDDMLTECPDSGNVDKAENFAMCVIQYCIRLGGGEEFNQCGERCKKLCGVVIPPQLSPAAQVTAAPTGAAVPAVSRRGEVSWQA